jgi:hypothetical protein
VIGWVDSEDLLASFGNFGFCSSMNELRNPTKNRYIGLERMALFEADASSKLQVRADARTI